MVNKSPKSSFDITLLPSYVVFAEPPLPLKAYLVSYEDVNCEEPLIVPLGISVLEPLSNPLGSEVIYDEVAALKPSTSVCIDDVNVLSDEISVLEPLKIPVPSVENDSDMNPNAVI